MDIVSAVATWAGLILAIASIVLAVVTIVFSRDTDRRSEAVKEQTITSLQKIETTVERLSSDTNGLIKAAWDKMLEPSAGFVPAAQVDSSALKTEIDEALAEIRSDLEQAKLAGGVDSGAVESLRTTVERLSDQVAAAGRGRPMNTSSRVTRVVRDLESASSVGLALASALFEGGRHLTSDQYERLRQSSLGSALREMEASGLLGPLRSRDESLVVWFPPSIPARDLETALQLVGPPPPKARAIVRSELEGVGYQGATKVRDEIA